MSLGRQPMPIPELVCRTLVFLGILKDFEISNIFIDPDYRGSGTADALMKFAERIAVGNWKRKEIILLVNKNNEAALKFYKKIGFEDRGMWRKAGIEKLEMAKRLERARDCLSE